MTDILTLAPNVDSSGHSPTGPVGRVSVTSGNISISWSGSGSGWKASSSNGSGTLAISGMGLELPITITGSGYSLAPTTKGPVIMFSESGARCGFLFSGPYLKTFDVIPAGNQKEKYTLSLLITNGTNTVWVDDPTIQFEPPD